MIPVWICLQNQYLFQIIFEDEFSCRLCYDFLQRFGLLNCVWGRMVRYLYNASSSPRGCDAIMTGLTVECSGLLHPCP